MARFTYIPNRVIDTDGISDGATLTFYEEGTTTPITVYSDAALTTPVGNPYTVAAGSAVPPLYYAESSVRVIVKDSGGATVSDDDPFLRPVSADELASTTPGEGASLVKLENGENLESASMRALGRSFSVTAESPAVLTQSTALTATLEDGDIWEKDISRLNFVSEFDSGALISLTNTGYNQVSVTSVTRTTRDISAGGGVSSQVTRISATGHSANVGEVWRLWADDALGHEETAGERWAEYVTVVDVDGSDVYVAGWVLGTYTTNIYMVRPSNARVVLKNGTINYTGSTAGAGGISLRGFINPIVNFRKISGFYSPALNIIGCYREQVSGYMTNLENASGALGYGVNAVGSQGGRYDLAGEFMRHLFTTNANSTSTNDDDWYQRGRNAYFRVSAVGSACAGIIDEHPDAIHGLYVGCSADNAIQTFDSSGAAYQLRGPNSKMVGCKSVGSKVGLNIIGYSDEDLDSHISIQGYTSIGDESPIRVTGSGGVQPSVDFDGTVIADAQTRGVLLDSCVVRMNNTKLHFSSNIPSSAAIADLDTATLTMNGLEADLSDSGQTNHRFYVARDANCVLRIRNAIIDEGGSAKLSSLGDSLTFDIDAEIEYEKDTTGALGFSNAGASSTLLLKATDGAARRNYIAVSYSTTGNKTLDLADSAFDVTWVRVTCTSTGVDITSIDPPKKAGQMLIIQSRDTSTQSFAINGSAVAGSGISAIAAQESVTLLADNGGAWHVAKSV